MRSLIPSPLWQMNTAVLTPQWSDCLPPSYFICEPGGSCKSKKGLFNNEAAEPPQSKNGLNLGSCLTWPLFCYCCYLDDPLGTSVTPRSPPLAHTPYIKQHPLVSEGEPAVWERGLMISILCSDI